VNNFLEKEIDFYALDLEQRRFEQVGTVHRKLAIKSKVDENLKQKTKKKTEIMNRKDAKTEVINPGNLSGKKSKSVRKSKPIPAPAGKSSGIKDMTEKPHFS
jgi:hypothetical protein